MKKEADEDGADKIKKAQQKERLVDVKTNGYWLGTMYNAFYRGENPESILNLDNLVNKINAKTIHQTAKKYLNTDNMIQVVAFPENM